MIEFGKLIDEVSSIVLNCLKADRIDAFENTKAEHCSSLV